MLRNYTLKARQRAFGVSLRFYSLVLTIIKFGATKCLDQLQDTTITVNTDFDKKLSTTYSRFTDNECARLDAPPTNTLPDFEMSTYLQDTQKNSIDSNQTVEI